VKNKYNSFSRHYGFPEALIALTFDDGPSTSTTPQMLDKLKEYGVAATFFVIGNNIHSDTDKVLLRTVEEGHEIGNHSLTHTNMTKQPRDVILSEVKVTNEKVRLVTGREPVFFRPPYIAVNQTVYDSIDMPLVCGIGSDDWDPKVTIEQRANLVLSQAQDGHIVLLHDFEGNDKTVAALDILIPALKSKGFQFVTVSELFKLKGIVPNTENYLYSNVLQTKPRI